MDDQLAKVSAVQREYEELLDMLPGVLHTKIKLAGGGKPAEIHILANQTRGPKQLVRDVQSALMARFGLDIDHRTVSVAQIHIEEDGRTAEQLRLVCQQVLFSVKNGVSSAQVTLSAGENEYTGEATDAADAFSRRMTVARATLDAVHGFLGQKMFSAVDVKLGSIADGRITTVAIGLQTGSRAELLVGAVYTDDQDASQSVVRATLDAINRRLCLLTH